MVWRSSNATQDRVLASLTYLIPILDVLRLGSFLFILLPPLQWLFLPLFYLAPIYSISLVQMGLFFGLFIGVVRNSNCSHFLRFNTMQALLLGIFAALLNIGLNFFGLSQSLLIGGYGSIGSIGVTELIIPLFLSAIFVFVAGASIYAIVQSLRGEYPEIPIISQAVYNQVR